MDLQILEYKNIVLLSENNMLLFQELKLRRWRWWTAWQWIYTFSWWDVSFPTTFSRCQSTTVRKKDSKCRLLIDTKRHFMSLFCSFPSTNPQQLGTKSSWRTRPFLQTTWVNLQTSHMLTLKHRFTVKSFLCCWNVFLFILTYYDMLHFEPSSNNGCVI